MAARGPSLPCFPAHPGRMLSPVDTLPTLPMTRPSPPTHPASQGEQVLEKRALVLASDPARCLHSRFSSANPSCALVPCLGLPLTSHLRGCGLSPSPSTVHLIKNYSSWISQGPAGSRRTLKEGDRLGRCGEEWGRCRPPTRGVTQGVGSAQVHRARWEPFQCRAARGEPFREE